MESPLSFNSSENFRKKLLVRNLPAYRVDGAFSSGDKPAVDEFIILDYSIVDSVPVEVIGDQQERLLYPINQYGPENKNSYGDMVKININRNYKTNEGEYGFPDSINSDLESIGNSSELYHIVKNVYKPQNNRNDYGDSVYYINNDNNINTVGSGEYNIVDTFNSFLFQIGNNSEVEHKVLNKYKPNNGGNTDFGNTKYEINNLLTLPSNNQIFGYNITYTINNALEQIGNNQETALIIKNKYSPENSSQYGNTKYSINNDLILGSNEGEYNYGDTIGDALELKGVEIRPTLFTNNEYRPENGQSVFEVEPFRIQKNLIIGSGNYGYDDTIGSDLEFEGKTDRPILIATNQYGPDNPIKGEAQINRNLQTKSNEGEYGYPDTVRSGLEVVGVDERKPTFLQNAWGPEGNQSSDEVDPYRKLKNLTINQGNYDVTDTNQNELEFVGGVKETEAYVKNKYVTGDGDYNTLTIQDLQYTTTGLPYANSDSTFVFVPSTYSPVNILLSDDPNGSDGSLSQDSQLAALGAKQLQKEFKHRVALELLQQTLGRANILNSNVNPDTGEISAKPNLDPFNAIGLLTGNIPIIARNYSITDPDLFLGQAINFAAKLAGTYSPYSYIPGEYFDYPNSKGNGPFQNPLSDLGGALGSLFSVNQPANQSSSELLVEYTSVATRSLLYDQLKYNPYRPNYKIGNNLLAPPGVFYIGNRKNHLTELISPVPELPYAKDGNSSAMGPVLSYSNMGKLYETSQLDETQFGINSRSFYSAGANKDGVKLIGGNISGGLTWIGSKSPSQLNCPLPGKLVGRGNQEFEDKSQFNFNNLSGFDSTKSTNNNFTPGSILDVTQKLIDAGERSSSREHVGQAINQVSKVFNDGYQELTKGSRVVRYTTKNSTPGGATEGFEYCRVFTKDRPYYTFDELQKTDGNIRKYTNSVLDKTFNLNIAPMGGVDSTNIKNGKVKKYMFSLENLSWRTSNRPGYTYEDLPDCEKGPNGGRIMWFPPYDLSFDENISTGWQDNTFLGRPEPIYTYSNTSRKGNVSFKIIVDHPSIMNVLVNKELENESSNETINQVIDSFFAGCTKYDLYDLVKKFPMFTPSDVFEVQLISTPEDIKTFTDTLPSTIIEKEVTTSLVPPQSPAPTPAPCTEWQISVGSVTTDLTYVDCDGTTITLTNLTSTATTRCIKSTTTPTFTVSDVANTATNTTQPCSTPPTVTATPPLVTEAPIKDQFPEVGFYFHNDFPDPNNSTRIYASAPYDIWLTKYEDLEPKYLNTGGNSNPTTAHSFGAALNKIIKYNDSSYTDYTTQVLSSTNAEQNQYLANYIDTRKDSISEFFSFINSEYTESQNFVKKISTSLDAGESVSFELLGSASALNNSAYNINLSKRRIDSVMQWMFNQKTPLGVEIRKYYTDGKLKIKQTPSGESGTLIEPKYSSISCTKDYKNESNEGVVSVNAMACRRVKIVDINVTNNNAPTQTAPTTSQTSPTNNDGNTSAIDPLPPSNSSGVNTEPVTPVNPIPDYVTQTPSGNTDTNLTPQSTTLKVPPTGKIEPKKRTDLTKRLARKLLTECNYFELVRQENPMIYDGIKSKIKHFHPVFHSITPEGLNSRLTFLQQCMRPGDTIPTVSKNDNGTQTLLYNDVTNSVFGAPPICVLRIGDFFHTKIAIDSLSIKYEDGRFDLNPEGIGVQPMIADVSVSFNFIGGHGLAGPIASLQNALSFNYYANTEMYDERAESTEDVTSQYDAEIFEDIKNQVGVIESDDDRSNTTDGGVPIGVPITTYLDANNLNLVSGTISYTEIMKKLIDNTKTSLSTTIDTLEKVNSEFLIGGLQILTKDRKYVDGYIGVGTTDNVKIFGKADSIQGKVENLITKAKEDVDNDLCPAIDGLNNQNFTDQEIRKIKNQIKSLIDAKKDTMIGSLENYSTQIGNEELKLINVIDKVNYVNNGHDGYINNKGNVIVYNVSGTTQVTPPVEASVINTLQELNADTNIIKNTLNNFYNQLNNGIIIPSGNTEYNDNFVFSCLLGNNIITENENRFFMLFGNDVLKDPIAFTSSILSPVQNTPNDVAWNAFILNNLGWKLIISLSQYVSEPIPNGLYSNYEVSKKTVDDSFKKFKDDYFNNTFNTFKPYNESKKRILSYEIILTSTSPYDAELKDIYSDSNSSGDKFNLKKTFT